MRRPPCPATLRDDEHDLILSCRHRRWHCGSHRSARTPLPAPPGDTVEAAWVREPWAAVVRVLNRIGNSPWFPAPPSLGEPIEWGKPGDPDDDWREEYRLMNPGAH